MHKITDVVDDVETVGTSGMESDVLRAGRPYGSCAILTHRRGLPHGACGTRAYRQQAYYCLPVNGTFSSQKASGFPCGYCINVPLEEKNTECTDPRQGNEKVASALNELHLECIRPIIQVPSTPLNSSIPADVRLAITLRYLATGDSYESMAVLFGIGNKTIGFIVEQLRHATGLLGTRTSEIFERVENFTMRA
ncbi:hypothetical protein CAPTEDRAFT_216350 [Capitella teleta]|uniref:Transposase Helix-turn-helix domain-containing protein n=1 Tax=Capitella teleta TaxID=283909 RepID=R7UGW5_CAPTE|nr:hypothetical protein CAPTEDRAFT_216350 [Capitella teleta]|eukprot:ELU02502.1 hypothetical protein CAPTEDRAFT_216350 [Capitella teleta]